jgi:hypothetical protein
MCEFYEFLSKHSFSNFFGILNFENSRIVSFVFNNLCVNSRNLYQKALVSKKNWGFGAYVLFGGFGLFGTYIIGAHLCLPYLASLYIEARPNFA